MVVAVRHSPLTHLNRLFSSAGQSTWFVISGSLVRIRQEAQKFFFSCCCSSGVEHFLGKEEVSGSNPDNSSKDSLHGLSFLFTTTLYHNYLQHKSLTLYKERNSNVLFHFLRLWIKNGKESGILGVFGACFVPHSVPHFLPECQFFKVRKAFYYGHTHYHNLQKRQAKQKKWSTIGIKSKPQQSK